MNNVLRAREGMTLLEILSCVVLLAVVFNVATTFFLSATRLNTSAQKRIELFVEETRLLDEIRDSVQAAKSIEAEYAGYRTGTEAIVLRMSDVDGAKAYCVFGLLDENGPFGKMVYRDRGQGPELHTTHALKREIEAYEFLTDGNRMVTFRAWLADDGETPPIEVRTTLRSFGGEES